MQAIIDSALQASNQRLATLKKTHQALLHKYTELEIKYIELQATQELDNLPYHTNTASSMRDSAFSSQLGDPTQPSADHRTSSALEYHHNQQHFHSNLPSPDIEHSGMRFPNSYFQQPTGLGSRSPATRSPTVASPGFMSYNMPHYPMSPNPPPITPLPPTPNQQFHDEINRRPSLRSANSMPTMESAESPLKFVEPVAEGNEDASSINTVGNVSQTSSERKRAEKVKASSEVRVRGRGELPEFS